MVTNDTPKQEEILVFLDENGYLFPQFELAKENNRPVLLGRGGFSEVYEMYNKKQPSHRYALKVMGFGERQVSEERFLDTARIQSILNAECSYTVRLITEKQFRREDLFLQFILTEKLEEIIVHDRFHHVSLKRGELSEEREVIAFALQIGQALRTAHSGQYMHRDIKLENIFWDEKEGIYKLGDFGLAKEIVAENANTLVYSDGYGAPEIVRKKWDNYSVRADIYSFGIALYLLLNDLKFPGASGYQPNVNCQYDAEFIFPAPAHASEAMTKILRKMTSYRAEDRYASMDEVLLDLSRVEQAAEVIHEANLGDEIEELTQYYKDEFETERYEDAKDGQTDDTAAHELTRAERIRRARASDKLYYEDSTKFFFVLTLVFALTLCGTNVDTGTDQFLLLWTIPAILCVDAILIRIREFHVIFGAFLIAGAVALPRLMETYGAGSMVLPGLSCLVILCVLVDDAVMALAAAAGVLLWQILPLTRFAALPEWILSHGFGWILLLASSIAINRYFSMKLFWDKLTLRWLNRLCWVYLLASIAMVTAGIILLVRARWFGTAIPDYISHMHLIATGVVSYFVTSLLMIKDGYLDEI